MHQICHLRMSKRKQHGWHLSWNRFITSDKNTKKGFIFIPQKYIERQFYIYHVFNHMFQHLYKGKCFNSNAHAGMRREKKTRDCQLHAKLPVGTLVVRHSENCAKQSKNDRKRQHLLQDKNNMKWLIQYNKLAGLDNIFVFYQINYVSEIPFKIKNY